MKIQGSVAIVTGGAQGIGRQICRALLKRGGKVAMLDIDGEKGFKLEDTMEKEYGQGRVLFINCDVTSNSQMKASFQKTKDIFGQINIVCNNAGILSDNEWENWEKTVDVNLKGVILGQFLGILHMGQSHGGKGGVIVNMASMAAVFPPPSKPIYTATKFAVLGLTQSSKDFKEKEGIRVNCICPSFTETQMVSNLTAKGDELLKRENSDIYSVIKHGLVSPELVANGIVELVEDESKNACVMAVTKKRGIEIWEPKYAAQMRNSKL